MIQSEAEVQIFARNKVESVIAVQDVVYDFSAQMEQVSLLPEVFVDLFEHYDLLMVAQDDLPLVFVDFDFLLVRQRLREVEDLRVRQLRVAISRPVRIEVDYAHLVEVFPFVTDH